VAELLINLSLQAHALPVILKLTTSCSAASAAKLSLLVPQLVAQ
jgi:hypothetical protein